MKNKFLLRLLLCIIFFGVLPTYAQWSNSFRSFQEADKKWIGGLNNRTSYYVESPSRITAIYAGISVKDKLRLTCSYNFSGPGNHNVPIDRNITYLPNGRITEDKSFRLRFFGLGAERVVYEKHHWQISIPLLVGLGSSSIKSRTSTIRDGHLSVNIQDDTRMIIPLEGAATALYLFNNWLGFKGSIGNRIVMGRGDVNAVFSGPFWQLGVLVYPSPLYEQITGKPLKIDQLFN